MLLPRLVNIQTMVIRDTMECLRHNWYLGRPPGIYELLRALPRTTYCRLICSGVCLYIDNPYHDIVTLKSDDFPTTYDLRSMVSAGRSALPLNSRPAPWAAYLPDSAYQEDQQKKLAEFFGSASAVSKSLPHSVVRTRVPGRFVKTQRGALYHQPFRGSARYPTRVRYIICPSRRTVFYLFTALQLIPFLLARFPIYTLLP